MAETDGVTPHALVGVQLLPQNNAVVISTRGPLAINAHDSVLSLDTIEGIFMALLQARLAARGIAVGLQQLPAPTPSNSATKL